MTYRISALTLLAVSVASGEVPAWFRETATATHPAYPGKTKAVALFHENTVRVEPTGKRTTTERKAIKILTVEGKFEASGGVYYDSRGSRVRDFKAWLIYPGGKQKEYTKKDFQEGSSQPSYTLYSTQRYYRINAGADVDPGTVFGYEATIEEDTVFSQFIWTFQDDLPHLLSRFQLTVPPGWKAEAKAYAGASAEAAIAGETYTWEARKLAPLEWEPGAPRFISLLPRVAVSMVPPEGTPLAQGPIACFRSWKDVSTWKSGLIDPRAEVTQAIEAKVSQLIEGKLTLVEKIRALSEFVQQIRYVNISINSARGGGYTPNKADEILKMAYGDCKDKANLLRTMLKIIAVESYPVGIYSGDPTYTVEDFASPFQFNHAILAIRVAEDVHFPAVQSYPEFGRFLFFDPTDSYVAFGYLPMHEQDSNVLITAGAGGRLVKTPKTEPQLNHIEAKWNLKLNLDGSVEGELTETFIGQAAFSERAQLERVSRDEYRKAAEQTLARFMAGAEILSLAAEYDAGKMNFRSSLKFRTPAYAKIMQGRLWMVRTIPTQFQQLPNVNKAERERPLRITTASFQEHVSWRLPENLKIDEVPESDRLEVPFGLMTSSWKVNGSEIDATRNLIVRSATVSLNDYKQAREFIMRFHGSGQAPVVLVSK